MPRAPAITVASSDRIIVAHHIRLDPLGAHAREQVERSPALQALVARRDGRIVAIDVRLDLAARHALEHFERERPVSTLVARGDGRRVGDGVRGDVRVLHLVEQLQRSPPPPRVVALLLYNANALYNIRNALTRRYTTLRTVTATACRVAKQITKVGD